jgi:antitoxin HigA-1
LCYEAAMKLHDYFAAHRAIWLREEIVQPRGLGVTELARCVVVWRHAMNKLMSGCVGLRAEMATRFEKTFGLQTDTLCRMQTVNRSRV